MADEATPSKTAGTSAPPAEAPATGSRRLPTLPGDVKAVRTTAARVLWAVCAIFALILATAALLIALEANTENDLVRWVIHRAADVDLGVFSLSNPIKDFDTNETDVAKDVKTALFNYGLAAIAWLLIGRIVERVVRP